MKFVSDKLHRLHEDMVLSKNLTDQLWGISGVLYAKTLTKVQTHSFYSDLKYIVYDMVYFWTEQDFWKTLHSESGQDFSWKWSGYEIP